MTYAMILCAGFGTRLNELTKNSPKPMLKLGDKPILEYTIEHLKRHGIKDIIINLHYLADHITSHFKDGSSLGVNIIYSYEEYPLGTSGAVKKVQNILSETDNFLILYGDVVTNQNYTEFINFHKSKTNAVGTIIIHERDKSNSIVEIDTDNKILKFLERPVESELELKKQNWVNSGLYCFNKEILNLIPDGISDFPKDIFPKLLQTESLYGFPLNGYRCAVDSSERYFMLQSDYNNGIVF
ncbi:MAG: nucleotidyltransferase family protein [Candidatus Gastranaerophilales bacterium]|nr:nucleotidyltransferase family protein [Candidatus Gastranaerophilales bacterium]